MLKLHLAVVGMEACKVSTLGSRERGHVSMEMHYQQLNIRRWFGTARCSISSEEPQLDSLRSNVLFQIGVNVYRVLTIYSKTYNKWLEVTSVPMGHLQKSANLYRPRYMLVGSLRMCYHSIAVSANSFRQRIALNF